MCGTCGCANGAEVRLLTPGSHPHEHPHDHGPHDDGPDEATIRDHQRTVVLEERLLAKNDALAQRVRDWLAQRGVLAVNLMSSPGAGKTTLLERTAAGLRGKVVVSVVEGDQETALDAERMRAAGCPVVQVNTGTGCHLDAEAVDRALRALDPPASSVVMIENVGNLVCPALFDLGEAFRVVLTSVTEGPDKPAKYPHMFRSADLVLVTKTDLLPHLDFDLPSYLTGLHQVTPHAQVLLTSARTGDGLEDWYRVLQDAATSRCRGGQPRRPPGPG